jgi:hypothetical protein
MSYVVTGECTSRLNELKKYKVTSIFTEQYFGNGSDIVNGVDYDISNTDNVIYYIDGIKYNDIIITSTTGNSKITKYSFIGVGYDSPNFINAPIYKNPIKDNIISNPKTVDDVFIERQELSVFDKFYRLEHVKSLSDFKLYAGGKYFYIKNNT